MGSPPTSGGCAGSPTSNCHTSPQLRLYQTIIFATPVIFAFMLMFLFCLFYLKRRRGASINAQMSTQVFAGGLLTTPPLEHGLSLSMRKGLPIVLFDEKFAATCQDTQCAVCLSDYQPNEKLQQLPVCHHSFHIQCIDEWLAKNTTCPICRTSLLEEDSMNAFQDINSSDVLLMREPDRLWEERVTGGGQDQTLPSRIDLSGGTSVAPSENCTQPISEHIIYLERS